MIDTLPMTKFYYTSSSGDDSDYRTIIFQGVHDLQCEEVNLAEHTTCSGKDFNRINPHGRAPCLILNDGTIIEDKIEILKYIEEHHVSHCI